VFSLHWQYSVRIKQQDARELPARAYRVAGGFAVCEPDGFAPWRASGGEGSLVLRLNDAPADSLWGAQIEQDSALGRFSWDRGSRALECRMPRSPATYSTAIRLACAIEAWEKNFLLLHTAGLLLAPGKAVLALAPSGGGKSTLTDLSGLPSLSDETVLVDLGPPIMVHGLPFRSASRIPPTNTSATLIALLFLEKSQELGFSPLSKQTAMPPRGASDLYPSRLQLFGEEDPSSHERAREWRTHLPFLLSQVAGGRWLSCPTSR